MNQEIAGITDAVREGAQAWKDGIAVNPYRDRPESQEYQDWAWGWDESQNYFEYQQALNNGTIDKFI